MTFAWPPSSMRAVRSFMFILRVIIVVMMSMGPSPVVTMAAGAAADRAVLILPVVDDDLRWTVGS